MEHEHETVSLDADLVRVPTKDAASICEVAGLPADALALLEPDDRPAVYLARLLQSERYLDAVTFLAQALPKREAVWWAFVALQQWLGDDASEADEQALAAAEPWIYDPNQEQCRKAGEIAAEGKYQTPAALVAAAVYWAGESIAPPDCPVVPPGGHLTGRAVAHAITLASMKEDDAASRDRTAQLFLAMGLKIAQGATSRTALTSIAGNRPSRAAAASPKRH